MPAIGKGVDVADGVGDGTSVCEADGDGVALAGDGVTDGVIDFELERDTDGVFEVERDAVAAATVGAGAACASTGPVSA